MYNQHHDHFDIELQGASDILQAQDQLSRDCSPDKVWLVCDAQLKVFTYCIVIIFLTRSHSHYSPDSHCVLLFSG
jgi:hypothetical protein